MTCDFDDTPSTPEFEEDVCDVCGALFKPLAGLRGVPTGCPECVAKRAEQGEAL